MNNLIRNTFFWRMLRYVRNYFKDEMVLVRERHILRKGASLGHDVLSPKPERLMLVNSHILEKGLCHSDYKARSGLTAVEQLAKLVDVRGPDRAHGSFERDVALASLAEYVKANEVSGSDLSDVVPTDLRDALRAKLMDSCAGSTEVSVDEYFGAVEGSFAEVAIKRRSLRAYDFEPLQLDRGKLERAVALATSTPSACNRQSVKVYSVTSRTLIMEMARMQGGCKGFGERSSAMLLVVADSRLYTVLERRLPYVDGGMFAMNLLYALYVSRLGACILNASFEPKVESRMRQMLGMSEFHIPVAMVAVTEVPEGQKFRVAKAPRRSSAEVLKWVG